MRRVPQSHQCTVMRPCSLSDNTEGSLEAQDQPKFLAHFEEVL